ncbi:MAG TPA: restriction endonuclease [Ktedonobacterales bacterium]|nr:restriction endonuclease [Ktedonobacterales bacterium]
MARRTSHTHRRGQRARRTPRSRSDWMFQMVLAVAAGVLFAFGLLAWVIWKALLWLQLHSFAVTALWGAAVLCLLLVAGGLLYRMLHAPFPGLRARQPNRAALARYYDQRGTLRDLQTMDPLAFERYIGRLFALEGYSPEYTARTGDEGVDIRLYPKNHLGLRSQREPVALVQCKRYADGHAVGSPEVQQFSGALRHEFAHRGYFVTTSAFTPAARKWAEEEGILLLDGLDLLKWRSHLLRRERLRLLFFLFRARRDPLAAFDSSPYADDAAASDNGLVPH